MSEDGFEHAHNISNRGQQLGFEASVCTKLVYTLQLRVQHSADHRDPDLRSVELQPGVRLSTQQVLGGLLSHDGEHVTTGDALCIYRNITHLRRLLTVHVHTMHSLSPRKAPRLLQRGGSLQLHSVRSAACPKKRD